MLVSIDLRLPKCTTNRVKLLESLRSVTTTTHIQERSTWLCFTTSSGS